MERWIPALVAGTMALACGSEPTRSARGPQTPELPSARRTAPIESWSADEATAGYSQALAATPPRTSVLPAVQLPPAQAPTPRSCPLALTGAAVRVVELPGVAVLEFSAMPSAENDLRAAVDAQAELYAERVSLSNGVPLYRVRVEGTRIVFEPTDPRNLDALRDDVIEHAAVMRQSKVCPLQ